MFSRFLSQTLLVTWLQRTPYQKKRGVVPRARVLLSDAGATGLLPAYLEDSGRSSRTMGDERRSASSTHKLLYSTLVLHAWVRIHALLSLSAQLVKDGVCGLRLGVCFIQCSFLTENRFLRRLFSSVRRLDVGLARPVFLRSPSYFRSPARLLSAP